MLNPMTPAPMTTVFGRDGDTMIGAVISDSLRRAHPTRFSGSDLSLPVRRSKPSYRAAPQPCANCGPGTCGCKAFLKTRPPGCTAGQRGGAVDAAPPNPDDISLDLSL